MKKSDENKTENCTIVNGVLLTDKAIEFLKEIQSHDNELLDDSCRIIADVICLVIKHSDDIYDSEKTKVASLLTELAMVRDNFSQLARP